MSRSAAQLRTVRDGLLRRMLPWRERSSAPAFSMRRAENCVQHQADEDRQLSAMRVIALAAVFNLTAPDSLAFPDTASDLQKRLSAFPFGGWPVSAMEDDGR